MLAGRALAPSTRLTPYTTSPTGALPLGVFSSQVLWLTSSVHNDIPTRILYRTAQCARLLITGWRWASPSTRTLHSIMCWQITFPKLVKVCMVSSWHTTCTHTLHRCRAVGGAGPVSGHVCRVVAAQHGWPGGDADRHGLVEKVSARKLGRNVLSPPQLPCL